MPSKKLSRKLPTLAQVEAEKCRRSLHYFVQKAWHIVEPDVVFVNGRHVEAICQYLEAVYGGTIRDLVINIPPRHMKSLLVNVFFPAWVWAKRPSKKFLFTSYGEDLAIRDSLKCKKLVQSEWYQERFDVQLATTPDTASKFENLAGGYRYSFGIGGAVTGHGADFVCVDDPLKATEADSETIRNKTNKDFDEGVSNRLNDPKTGGRIIIMQRLHERDLTGHIVSKGLNYEMLVLPAEYEGERFTSSIGFKDWRTETGELLWPERFGRQEIDYMKKVLSERGVAGQLQQRPSPAGGFVFKREWFPRLHQNSDVVGVYISWDTAESINPDAAYSCATVGELRSDYTLFVKEVVRKRLLFPQLQKEIEELAQKYQEKLVSVIIENKSSGIQAVQSLRQSSPTWLAEKIVAFNPKGAKEARAFQAATYCEKTGVILPHPSDQFEWLKEFEDEIFMFPSSAYRDQTDSLSQLILFLRHYLSEGWRARTNNTVELPQLEGIL